MKHKTYDDGILYNGDCLKVMPKLIQQGIKVDAIITDVPYGTTQCKWDSIIPLPEMWDNLKKIIKPNSNILLFSSMPYTSKLVNSNIEWFSHQLIWEKNQATNFLLANIMPLKIHEEVIVFKPSSADFIEMNNLKNYFYNLLKESNKTKKEMIKIFGGKADHCFRKGNQWSLPSKEIYQQIINYLKPSKIIPYETLLNEYHSLTKNTYNPQKSSGTPYTSGLGKSGEAFGNVEKIQTINTGDRFPTSILYFKKNSKQFYHPTQKPVELMEYLIKTYTNEKDLVLDFTCGSGSTLVACRNLNRRFIGIEKEEKYYQICKKRLRTECIKSIF